VNRIVQGPRSTATSTNVLFGRALDALGLVLEDTFLAFARVSWTAAAGLRGRWCRCLGQKLVVFRFFRFRLLVAVEGCWGLVVLLGGSVETFLLSKLGFVLFLLSSGFFFLTGAGSSFLGGFGCPFFLEMVVVYLFIDLGRTTAFRFARVGDDNLTTVAGVFGLYLAGRGSRSTDGGTTGRLFNGP
jgi:hypothetical protein